MYEGLHRKITSAEFLMDLGLKHRILQKLAELILDVQEHDMDLYGDRVKTQNILLKYMKKEMLWIIS
jgi:hypothetical protein